MRRQPASQPASQAAHRPRVGGVVKARVDENVGGPHAPQGPLERLHVRTHTHAGTSAGVISKHRGQRGDGRAGRSRQVAQQLDSCPSGGRREAQQLGRRPHLCERQAPVRGVARAALAGGGAVCIWGEAAQGGAGGRRRGVVRMHRRVQGGAAPPRPDTAAVASGTRVPSRGRCSALPPPVKAAHAAAGTPCPPSKQQPTTHCRLLLSLPEPQPTTDPWKPHTPPAAPLPSLP